jgi:anti-sigma B factor antagonist
MSLHNGPTSGDAAATGGGGPDGAAQFRVYSEPEARGIRVCAHGEIDLATVDRVRLEIERCVASGYERVMLDLRAVTFIDSTGVHLVIDADTAARTGGWDLQVIDAPGPVQRLFELTGLRDRLPFVEPAALPDSETAPATPT